MNDQRIMSKIIKLRGAIEHIVFKSYLKEFPLPDKMNQSHLMTMMILCHHKDLSMSELSQFIGMEKGSFTPVADRLIKLGYVISVRSEKDRRRYNLNLTEKGQTFAQTFRDEHAMYIEDQINILDHDAEKEFIHALDTILEKFDVLMKHSKLDKPFHK